MITNGNISGNPYYNLVNFPVRTKPMIGIGITMDYLRVSNLSVNLDFIFRSFDWTNGYYRDQYALGNYREVFIDYSMQSFRTMFTVTKGWQYKNIIPYLRVGGFGGKLFNMQGDFYNVLVVNGAPFPNDNQTPFGINDRGSLEMGWIFGTGLSYKSFSLEGRIEQSNGFSGSNDKSFSSIRSIGLIGQYRF